jgi:uncharacterized protein (DUF885 family)
MQWCLAALIVPVVACGGSDFPSPAEIRAELTGLPLEEFYQESFEHILRREPEWVTSMGIDSQLGLPGDQLDNISVKFLRESWRVHRVILELLSEQYDRDLLSAEERIHYDSYQWWLDDIYRSGPYRKHDYPVTQMIGSQQISTPWFMTEVQPVTSEREAEAYITRLGAIDDKIDQLIEQLDDSADHDMIAPRRILSRARQQVQSIADTWGSNQPLFTAFANKLELVDELDGTRRHELREQCADIIENQVRPAYNRLDDRLAELFEDAVVLDGVSNLPDGDAYYTYALRHHTTTDLSAQQIFDMGMRELERIHAEMRTRFDALGYPDDEGLPALYQRVIADSGTVAGNDVVDTYTQIIREAEANLDDAFDIAPSAAVVVIGGATGGYYSHPSFDGSRPGAFYANAGGQPEPRYAMRSLAYHEAVPGHHHQIGIATDLADQPLFRRAINFTAYAEGWALYAERLAGDLGWYDSDPHGDLGRLQWEALRAARLVADTGIHAHGWSHDQAVQFFRDNLGFDDQTLWAPGQVTRYVAWPGQATAYMVGMLRILDLRQQAENRLGDDFSLIDFHHEVLGHGAVPLEVLTSIVDDM